MAAYLGSNALESPSSPLDDCLWGRTLQTELARERLGRFGDRTYAPFDSMEMGEGVLSLSLGALRPDTQRTSFTTPRNSILQDQGGSRFASVSTVAPLSFGKESGRILSTNSYCCLPEGTAGSIARSRLHIRLQMWSGPARSIPRIPLRSSDDPKRNGSKILRQWRKGCWTNSLVVDGEVELQLRQYLRRAGNVESTNDNNSRIIKLAHSGGEVVGNSRPVNLGTDHQGIRGNLPVSVDRNWVSWAQV